MELTGQIVMQGSLVQHFLLKLSILCCRGAHRLPADVSAGTSDQQWALQWARQCGLRPGPVRLLGGV